MSESSSRAGMGEFFTSPSTGDRLYNETWSPSGGRGAGGGGGGGGIGIFLVGVHESADTENVIRLAKGFADSGFKFTCLEHHGHGRSDGQRALVKSWDLLCTHALEFLESIANKYPDDKLFLMGHSMGGGVATWIGQQAASKYGSRFGGCVLFAPSLSGPPVHWATEKLLTAVCYFAPWAPLGPPENPEAGMPPAEAAQFRNSPHNYVGNMRLSTGKMFLDFFRRADQAMSSGSLTLSFPMLILHGDKDHTVELAASKRIMECSTSVDKTLKVLKGKGHQPVCAEGWREVVGDAVDWARNRL